MPKPGYTNTPYGPVPTSLLNKGPTLSKETSQAINALSKMSPAQVKAASQAANLQAVTQAKFAAQSASQQKSFNVAAIKAQTAAQKKQAPKSTQSSGFDLNDPKAPWNQGDWKKFNNRLAAKQYWTLANDDSGLMTAGRTLAYFTPVVGAGLSFGDAASSFEKGDVGGGLLNVGLGAAGGLGAFRKLEKVIPGGTPKSTKNTGGTSQSAKVTPKKPAPVKPAPVKPAPKKPVPKKPVAKKPVAKKPVAKNPVAKKPVAKKPATKKPVAKKPAAKKPGKKLVAIGTVRTIANPDIFTNNTTTTTGGNDVGGVINPVPQTPEPLKTTPTDDVKVVNTSDFVENYEDTQSDYAADSLALFNSLSTSEILEVARNYDLDTSSININANILDIVNVVNSFSPTEIVKLQRTSNVYFSSFGENLQKNSSGLAQAPGLAEILVPQKNDNNSYKIQIEILAPKTIQRGTAYPIA